MLFFLGTDEQVIQDAKAAKKYPTGWVILFSSETGMDTRQYEESTSGNV